MAWLTKDKGWSEAVADQLRADDGRPRTDIVAQLPGAAGKQAERKQQQQVTMAQASHGGPYALGRGFDTSRTNPMPPSAATR